MSVPPPYPNMHNQNVAGDNAHVDQQIGAIFGATFHRNQTIYNINQTDPPERKLEVALNHLGGGTPRMAEKILAELVQQGHSSTRHAYYYALAVLSDRSLNEIDNTVYASFRTADLTAKRFAADGWCAALDVVWELTSCVWRQQIGEALDTAVLTKALGNFKDLPKQRQDEITRHLGMVLGGAVQDSLDVVDADRVREERLQPDRAGRAWKFFEPDPAAPRYFVMDRVDIPQADWTRLLAGSFGLLLGLGTFVTSFGNGNPGVGIFALLIFLVGAGLAFVSGLEWNLQVQRLAARDREHGIPLQYQSATSPGHWVPTDFVKQIHSLVESRFWDARPHIAGSWVDDTRGICEYYKWRFVALFGNAQVEATMVNWLIRWHARRAAAQWRDGTLFSYREKLKPSSMYQWGYRLGFGIAAIGVLSMIGGKGGFVGAAFLLGLGGFFTLKGGLRVFMARRFHAEEEMAGKKLLKEEEQAYADWLEVLRDRPTDAEMARWLDLDKSYLKTEALRRCALTNRDLVTHVVLTEGAANARRARVIHGPPRYSAYVVLVFLLTSSGVREVEVDLDFLSGDVHDERRTSFRYDALAAARVAEVGVRYADGWRYQIISGDSMALLQAQTLRKRAFRLSLVSGEEISVIVESFEGLADAGLESDAMLNRIALESSGIAGALHVLEAVSAEGRDWITREQERRRRRSEDWRREQGPGLLDGSPFDMPDGD